VEDSEEKRGEERRREEKRERREKYRGLFNMP
jgi:hypothetical protein